MFQGFHVADGLVGLFAAAKSSGIRLDARCISRNLRSKSPTGIKWAVGAWVVILIGYRPLCTFSSTQLAETTINSQFAQRAHNNSRPKSGCYYQTTEKCRFTKQIRRLYCIVFRRQLSLARQLEKPVVIHSRAAEQDTVSILKEILDTNHRIHLHCFNDRFVLHRCK